MKRIDLVYETLKKLYTGKGLSAVEIAHTLKLSRANVSNDLNKLCTEGKVSKSSGRPVLFNPIDNIEYNEGESKIDRFTRENQSLYTAVEQAKAAILYPPKGMHVLILGETGVGKSMFAGLIHQYAIEMKRMEEKAPFVTFNCADYANNPQLLISQLFGTKKGAYTGADSDKIGLIEKADGGILFLDEVHRLPPEGQEMFFTFMDKGTFRKLGETETERRADVLIVSATTESPESTLLKTFTRRIPMVIKIPSLSERTMEERFYLISNFYREESFRLDREIMVSINSMRAFLSYYCPNNIGQLKTDIQLACAKAYVDFVSKKKQYIKINSTDLPTYVREGLYIQTEHRQIFNKLIGINKRYCVFNKLENNSLLEKQNYEDSIYDMIDHRIDELRDKGIQGETLQKEMEKDIEDYFTRYIYCQNRNVDITNLESIIPEEIVKTVQDIISFSEEKLNRTLSQRAYYGIAVHISNSLERIKRNKLIVNPKLNSIRTEFGSEFNVALDCLKIIERSLDVTMPIDEAGFLAMFFVYDEKDIEMNNSYVKVIVVAHGSSTAASMAEVANKLLGINNVIGINAPLEEKPKIVLSRLKNYIIEHGIKSDVLLLVDMGSLTTFGEEVEKDICINVKTIPLVSTLHVVEAARKAAMGYSLEEVYRETVNVNNFLEYDTVHDRTKIDRREKLVIITMCTTGEGSAIAIKNLLEQHLEYDKSILEIIPVNLVENENIYSRIKSIRADRNIICIVSAFNLETKLPQFRLDEVLSLRAIKTIQGLIDIEMTYIKMGETLEHQLKNVEGREAFIVIKKCIGSIEKEMNIKTDTDILIGVTLHIGCMIDRIKSGGTIIKFEDKGKFIETNKELYNSVKKSCKLLEEKFNIHIFDDELCHIMRFFNYNNYS